MFTVMLKIDKLTHVVYYFDQLHINSNNSLGRLRISGILIWLTLTLLEFVNKIRNSDIIKNESCD